MIEPMFTHDCDECVLVDQLAWAGLPSDIYCCRKQGYATIIARYGDDGPDYTSWPIVAFLPHLRPLNAHPR